MSNIEEQLWNYIDGTATAEEQQTISRLIAQHEEIRLKYLELLDINSEFAKIELDEPPMAFTYNVMEAIRKEEALKPLKSKFNVNIIKGISGFFILTLVAFVILALASINWSAGNTDSIQINLTVPQIPNIFTGTVMRTFLYTDLVLGLYFFSRYLRRRQFSGDFKVL